MLNREKYHFKNGNEDYNIDRQQQNNVSIPSNNNASYSITMLFRMQSVILFFSKIKGKATETEQ